MAPLSYSERIRLKIGLAEGLLDQASSAFWTSPRLEEIFPAYLTKLHASMRASVPMMEHAVARAQDLAPACPVAAELIPYLEHHIEEEQDHDLWLLDDMEALGFDREEVLGRPPDPQVASMIGAYYYWIYHAHPVAIMSYFAVVEGNPVSPATLNRVAAETSLPPRALRTIYKHAELDPHHSAEVDELIDRLPLAEEHAALLEVSALTTIEQLTRIILDLLGTERYATV